MIATAKHSGLTKKKLSLDDYIKENALPGENWAQAKERLRNSWKATGKKQWQRIWFAMA